MNVEDIRKHLELFKGGTRISEPMWVEVDVLFTAIDEKDRFNKQLVTHLNMYRKSTGSMIKLLRKLEWCNSSFRTGDNADYPTCPLCYEMQKDGHASDCELAKELKS